MGDALGSRATRPADPVHVVLYPIHPTWHVVVNDDANALHVEASGGHVRGDQHSQGAVLERVDNLGPFPLSPITVERVDGESIAPELVCELMTIYLLGHKDDHLGVLLPAEVDGPPQSARRRLFHHALVLGHLNKIGQDLLQLIRLFVLTHHMDFLGDVLVRYQGVHLPDINLDGIREEVVRQPLDLLGPGGRE